MSDANSTHPTPAIIARLKAFPPGALLSRKSWKALAGGQKYPARVQPVREALRRVSVQMLAGGVMQSNAEVNKTPSVPEVRVAVAQPAEDFKTWYVPGRFIYRGTIGEADESLKQAEARLTWYEEQPMYGEAVVELPAVQAPVFIGYMKNSGGTEVWGNSLPPVLVGVDPELISVVYPPLEPDEFGWRVLT